MASNCLRSAVLNHGCTTESSVKVFLNNFVNVQLTYNKAHLFYIYGSVSFWQMWAYYHNRDTKYFPDIQKILYILFQANSPSLSFFKETTLSNQQLPVSTLSFACSGISYKLNQTVFTLLYVASFMNLSKYYPFICWWIFFFQFGAILNKVSMNI